MLVRFSSTKTESITMFGDVAIPLIRMLGASGRIPGAISAEDIPAALAALRQQLTAEPPPAEPASRNDDADEDREPPVPLRNRAIPLIELLERAAAARVPVMWDRG